MSNKPKKYEVCESFRIKRRPGFAYRFCDIDIDVAFPIETDRLNSLKKAKIPAKKYLFEKLESEFNGTDFRLVLTNSKSPKFEFDKNNKIAFINLEKWYNHFSEIKKIHRSYRISKYNTKLISLGNKKGSEYFFSSTEPSTIEKDIDKTNFKIIEQMLKDFDNLRKSEKNALLENVDLYLSGRILKKYEKLDMKSPQLKAKSVALGIDSLNIKQIRELLISIAKSKKGNKALNELKKLPLDVQATLLSNADKAAQLLLLYNHMDNSLREFQNLIKKHGKRKKKNEKEVHAFLAENYWILGVEYFNQTITTDINPLGKKTGETYHKDWRIFPDFEIYKIDGSIDRCVVIELEAPNDKIFNKDGSLSKESLDGLYQAITYTIFHRVEKNRIAKGIAVLGSVGKKITAYQKKKLEILSDMFPSIEIKTYEDLIEDSSNVIKFLDKYLEDPSRNLTKLWT